jgi:2-methylcitrate dehydratase PrpD
MTKRLHPGLAARDGLLSAYLAHRSISGPHYILEAEDGGFYRLFSDKWDLDQLDRPSERYAIEDVEHKWFASCKSVHSPITAALQVHLENPGYTPGDVREIIVEVNASAISMAGRMYEPGSVISAQLSIPYGVALGICGRPGQSSDYDPKTLMDCTLFELARKVKVVESQEMNDLRKREHKSGARVTAKWSDGHSAAVTVTTPRGSFANPLTEEDLLSKFDGMTEAVLGNTRSAALRKLIVTGAEDTPISEIYKLLTPVNF